MKHAPGPWEVTSHNGRPAVYSESCCVATCSLQEDGEANAHLIAAAPELMDACQRALVFMQGDQPAPWNSVNAVMAILKKAIAKAEGRIE